MKKGFTLIELLVVVLIIGILAAVALPQYEKVVSKSRTSEAVITMKALSSAEEVYYLANGTYTSDLSNLDIDIANKNEYYTYSCYDVSFPSCLAKPKKDGYPAIEFVLSQGLPWWASKSFANKRWCQILDAKDVLSNSGKEKAINICKSFGPQDQDSELGGKSSTYYIIQ